MSNLNQIESRKSLKRKLNELDETIKSDKVNIKLDNKHVNQSRNQLPTERSTKQNFLQLFRSSKSENVCDRNFISIEGSNKKDNNFSEEKVDINDVYCYQTDLEENCKQNFSNQIKRIKCQSSSNKEFDNSINQIDQTSYKKKCDRNNQLNHIGNQKDQCIDGRIRNLIANQNETIYNQQIVAEKQIKQILFQSPSNLNPIQTYFNPYSDQTTAKRLEENPYFKTSPNLIEECKVVSNKTNKIETQFTSLEQQTVNLEQHEASLFTGNIQEQQIKSSIDNQKQIENEKDLISLNSNLGRNIVSLNSGSNLSSSNSSSTSSSFTLSTFSTTTLTDSLSNTLFNTISNSSPTSNAIKSNSTKKSFTTTSESNDQPDCTKLGPKSKILSQITNEQNTKKKLKSNVTIDKSCKAIRLCEESALNIPTDLTQTDSYNERPKTSEVVNSNQNKFNKPADYQTALTQQQQNLENDQQSQVNSNISTNNRTKSSSSVHPFFNFNNSTSAIQINKSNSVVDSNLGTNSNNISNFRLHSKLEQVQATLEMKELWTEFSGLGTEMIVTKSGR